ncbi:MAG: hypothetical protein R3C15_19985 [Thermoleophilia bacterium]
MDRQTREDERQLSRRREALRERVADDLTALRHEADPRLQVRRATQRKLDDVRGRVMGAVPDPGAVRPALDSARRTLPRRVDRTTAVALAAGAAALVAAALLRR